MQLERLLLSTKVELSFRRGQLEKRESLDVGGPEPFH